MGQNRYRHFLWKDCILVHKGGHFVQRTFVSPMSRPDHRGPICSRNFFGLPALNSKVGDLLLVMKA